MSAKRNISGIYFRSQNKETGKWENVCFEELSEGEQDKILDTKDIEFIKRLAKLLAKSLDNVCIQFDISRNENS
jgi:hypothetical protein